MCADHESEQECKRSMEQESKQQSKTFSLNSHSATQQDEPLKQTKANDEVNVSPHAI